MQENEDLPVIQLGPISMTRTMALAAVGAVVAVIVASVLLWPGSSNDQTAVTGAPVETDPVELAPATETSIDSAETDAEVDAADPAPAGGGTITLDREAAGAWMVVGTDNLNIRQAPGIASEAVGSLAAGQRNVEATGERASVNGAEWKQIRYGDQASLGWVSALYLAPDTDAPSPAPAATESTLCFRSGDGGRQIVLQLSRSSSGQTWSGLMREDSGETTSYDVVNGTGAGPNIEVIMTDTADNSERTATWTLDGQSLVFMDGTPVRVAPCSDIAGLLPNT